MLSKDTIRNKRCASLRESPLHEAFSYNRAAHDVDDTRGRRGLMNRSRGGSGERLYNQPLFPRRTLTEASFCDLKSPSTRPTCSHWMDLSFSCNLVTLPGSLRCGVVHSLVRCHTLSQSSLNLLRIASRASPSSPSIDISRAELSGPNELLLARPTTRAAA